MDLLFHFFLDLVIELRKYLLAKIIIGVILLLILWVIIAQFQAIYK